MCLGQAEKETSRKNSEIPSKKYLTFRKREIIIYEYVYAKRPCPDLHRQSCEKIIKQIEYRRKSNWLISSPQRSVLRLLKQRP